MYSSSPYETVSAPKVAFISSVQDRYILPLKIPNSRLGKKTGLLPTEHPRVGPASYDVEEKTNQDYHLTTHPESLKGYSLGARTAQRLPLEHKDGLGKIGDDVSPHTVAKRRFQPFQVHPTTSEILFLSSYETSSPSFPSPSYHNPGTYKYNVSRNRKVLFQQSFGGKPVNMPEATFKSSIPINTEKLSSSHQEQKYHKQLAYLKLYY